MVQYIDKDAILAEIESLWKHYLDAQEFDFGWNQALDKVRSYLDFLETKEVDLKEEIDKIWKPRFNLGWDDKSLLSVSYEGFGIIAKHFFELGFNAAQKRE